MRTVAVLFSGLALAACATVATTLGFPAADADDNEMLSQSEFDEVFDDTRLYGNFDDNDDGMLSREEYNEAVDDLFETDAYFHGFDRDRSGMLSRQEFINGWFNTWDGDRSGSLDRREFTAAMNALEPEL